MASFKSPRGQVVESLVHKAERQLDLATATFDHTSCLAMANTFAMLAQARAIVMLAETLHELDETVRLKTF